MGKERCNMKTHPLDGLSQWSVQKGGSRAVTRAGEVTLREE